MTREAIGVFLDGVKIWRDFRVSLIILVLLLLAPLKTMAADINEVNCSFGGKPLESGCQVIEKAGVRFANLPFLNRYLHVITKWEPESGAVELRFGTLNITLNEDSLKYSCNKEQKKLEAAPFRRDEQLWIPLELILSLGIEIKKAASSELWLDWAANYLLQIEAIQYQNRPAYLLIGSKSLTVKESNLIINPDRLLVDLAGVKLHPSLNTNVLGRSNVKKIRLSQRDSENVRLVFDLAILNGYRIITNPDHEEQLIIVFNYFLQGINLFQQGSVRKVQILTSLPAQYQVSTLVNPHRLLIDLQGATLNTTDTKITGDGQWVAGVRAAQFDPHTVRVVLDLQDTIPCYVARSAENPNLIEVRTVQTITRIDWAVDRLVITGDGELEKEITRARKGQPLRIDLDYFQLKPGFKPPEVQSKLVKTVRVMPITPITVRIEVDLKEDVIYETAQTNKNELVVYFKPSVLQGKTIVLDAGHGGVDPGTCGSQGTREKDFTLDVTMRLKDLLEEAGADVVLSRADDSYIGLFERSMLANYVLADVFISIHCNSFIKDSNVRGIEVYYYQGRNDGKLLADKVLEKLVEFTGLSKRGVKFNNYVVLRESQMAAVLIELGYLSNFEEEALLQESGFRGKAAEGIFKGLVNYYQQ